MYETNSLSKFLSPLISFICGKDAISVPGIVCGTFWGSFPVLGSFAVQFGDHLRACTALVSFAAVIRVVTQRFSPLMGENRCVTTLMACVTTLTAAKETSTAQTFLIDGRQPEVYVFAFSSFSCTTNELQSSHFSIYNLT